MAFMIGIIILLSVVSPSVPESPTVSPKCPKPWVHYRDSCYLFNDDIGSVNGHTRQESRLICLDAGGDLTSIRDKNESDFISKIFQNPKIRNSRHLWIGLDDKKVEGNYQWTDGTEYNFSNWRVSEKEPNNYNDEDCVEISYDGQWNDNKCYHKIGFICKRSVATVVPTSTLPPYPTEAPTQAPTESVILTTPGPPRTCEAGWIPWGTSCYGMIKGIPKTWDGARADCLRRFGDLVIIDTKAELDFLTNEISRFKSEYWIGLTDIPFEGKFHWVDGTPLSDVTSWNKGQPSNDYEDEHCVEMYGKWAPGKWNDNYCDSIQDYICEKKSGVHNCPQGWVTYKDYCYQFNAHPNQKVTWYTARNNCLSYNEPWKDTIDVAKADLVSITNKEEETMIYNEFKKIRLYGRGNFYWTGLHRKDKSRWVWSDRIPYKYEHFITASGLSSYRCARANLGSENGGWFRASCYQKNNYVCKLRRGQDRCFDPMGMQNFEIPDSSITASDQDSEKTPPSAARLYVKSTSETAGAWCAKNGTKRRYLQIDFGSPQKLTYMAVQGQSNSNATVTSFYLTYSLDNISWDTYGDYPPAPYYNFRIHVRYRTDYEKVMTLPLPSHLVARYIRIYPIECHVRCCLRTEFYGCAHDVENHRCGLGWIEDKSTGHCYILDSHKTSWDAAAGLCEAQGASLLSITSAQEKAFIESQLKPQSWRRSDYWIGLNDLDEEGVFQWLDKSPLTLTNWYRDSPKIKDGGEVDCVTIRSQDGFWENVNCMSYRTFICKRTYRPTGESEEVKFNNNWRSEAAYYWPLDGITNGVAMGTKPALAFGNIAIARFPVPFDSHTPRSALSFDGKTSYLKVEGLEETCVTNPDSSSCPHGFTMSFLFYYGRDEGISRSVKYIMDSTGGRAFNIGYRIYIRFKRISVGLRGHHVYYNAFANFPIGRWNHLVFRWSTLEGLKLYLNGQLKFRQMFGNKNPTYVKASNISTLLIGKGAISSRGLHTRIKLASLAIFEKVLSVEEILKIYRAEFGRCKWGQIAHGSYCYEFNVTELNFYYSSRSCMKKSGNLLSVQSPIEQSLLTLSIGKYGLNRESWIGLHSKRSKQVYNWTDNSLLQYTHWGANEPDNFRGRIEDCVATNKDGIWRDSLCFFRKSFVCKYERELFPLENVTSRREVFNLTMYYYQTKTFGCSLSQKVQLLSVVYGSVRDKCLMDEDKAMAIVQKKCKGPLCSSVRASDAFFKTNPCAKNRFASKRLRVSYECVEDEYRAEGCLPGYSTFFDDGVCYKLYQHDLNITDAEKACGEDGAALASIGSSDEELFLTTLIGQLYKKSDIWIGMKYDNSRYSWMNGQPITYTNWYNKLPDPRVGNYVKVSVHQGPVRFIFWNSASGAEKLPFFCRKLKESCVQTAPNSIGMIQCCVFPFIYKGKSYDRCTYKDHHRRWCATTPNYDKDKKWGNCTMPGNESPKQCQMTEPNAANVTRCCHFPFKYNDKEYNECTDKDHHRKWCGTTADYDKDQRWGNCTSPIQLAKATERPPVTTMKPNGTCPKDWIRLDNYCYYGNKKPMSFVDAQLTCSQKVTGAQLASISSQEENDLLFKIMSRQPRRWFSAWIGLTNEAIIRGYHWVDGQPLSYINWSGTSPYTGQRHLCVGMNSGGTWWDLPCHSKYHSLCKVVVGSEVITTPPIIVLPSQGPLSKKCQTGWNFYNGSCYFFSKDLLDYHMAQRACVNMSSNLASIHSKEENAFVKTISQRTDKGDYYIGLHDMSTENGWEWEDGSVVQYINWISNQPDNWYGEEDCATMQSSGKWNDVACNWKARFVCKQSNDTSVKIRPTPAVGKNYWCDDGWVLYGSKCYLFKLEPTDRRKHSDAKSFCRDFKGGDLVSIHHNYENAFLLSQLKESTTSVYIGFGDYMKEGEYFWTDQSSVGYTNWHVRQPSGHRYEDCVLMFPFYHFRGRWDDISCKVELGFVCQKPPNSNAPKPTPQVTSELCPEGYKLYAKDCYTVITTPKTWNGALEECRKKDNGDLLSIHDPYRQAFVFSQFAHVASKSWIGLFKKRGEKEVHWSDESTLDYLQWKNNRKLSSQANNSCVYQEFSEKVDGAWSATNCTVELPFACKITRERLDAAPIFLGNCSEGWTKFGKMCYKYFHSFKDRSPWPVARQKCKRFGGDLVTVENKAVQNLIFYLIRSTYTAAWIGLNDREKEHVFKWSSGKPFSVNGYTNWNYREPNDNVGTENCVEILAAKGKWNDLNCIRQRPFVCEHPLECREALGMESKAIPDSAINATSYYGHHYPNYARLNAMREGKHTAWCTNVTDGKQTLTINLGELMTITSISTQGMYPYYVVTYKLFYSDDGQDWKLYSENNGPYREPRLMPGNKKGNLVEGTPVNLRAVFLKFLPVLTSKEGLCLRIELFGCKSVCSRALGMTNHHIPDENLKASSFEKFHPITYARPNNGYAWCAKTADPDPWYSVDLGNKMKVTRVMVHMAGRTEYVLQYSDDGEIFKVYYNTDGTARIFSSIPSVHDLDHDIVSRYIKIVPRGSGLVCLTVEFYGCEFECDVPLGMGSMKIPNALVTASSSHKNFPPHNARIQAPYAWGPTMSPWCAEINDRSQYLQIDFVEAARITYISIQGYSDPFPSYVESYNLQWSNDGDFWHHYKEELPGNIDGDTIHKYKLEHPMLTRYLRINPTMWINRICMRVEVYGCPLGNITVPTEPPKPHKSVFLGNLRLVDEVYSDNLTDPTTKEYKILERKIQNAVTSVYMAEKEFSNRAIEVIINSFKPGSVVVDFTVIMIDEKAAIVNPKEVLETHIKKGTVGELKVEKDFLVFKKEVEIGVVAQTDPSGLSEGGKIGLLVFFFLVIAAVLIAGVVVYLRRSKRGFKLQFAHRTFQNPIHGDFGEEDKVQFIDSHD